MGRADQTTKVKGMFVRPEQVAEIGKRHAELGRLRLVVTREGETDVMTLRAECGSPSEALQNEVASTLRAVTNSAVPSNGWRPAPCRTTARRYRTSAADRERSEFRFRHSSD